MDTMPAKVSDTLRLISDSYCPIAALNMAMKLLSLDVKDHGIAVCSIHPGFMRTEMTKSVGFDKYWDDGGGMLYYLGSKLYVLTFDLIAVTPDEAAKSLAEWISKDFDISKTGTYWAPRGPA